MEIRLPATQSMQVPERYDYYEEQQKLYIILDVWY